MKLFIILILWEQGDKSVAGYVSFSLMTKVVT